MNEGDARYWILDAGYWVRDKKCGHRMLKVRMRCSHADYWMPGSLNPAVSTRSLLKNYNHSSCGGADALTSLLLPYRSLRICSVLAPRHRVRRAHNLNCRSFSTDSYVSGLRQQHFIAVQPVAEPAIRWPFAAGPGDGARQEACAA